MRTPVFVLLVSLLVAACGGGNKSRSREETCRSFMAKARPVIEDMAKTQGRTVSPQELERSQKGCLEGGKGDAELIDCVNAASGDAAVRACFSTAVNDYVSKSKRGEVLLQLDNLVNKIKVYHIEKAALPPSAQLMPPTAACTSPTGTTGRLTQSEWAADPGWSAIDFYIVEDSLFQYRWTKVSETEGFAEAIGDLDCDVTMTTHRVNVRILEGDIVAEQVEPTPD